MRKNGFTLIEFLAVIVVLTVIMLIANNAVTQTVRNSRETINEKQTLAIKSAAETWGGENINKLPKEGTCGYITLGDLKEYGLLDSKVSDIKSGKELSDDLKIKVETKVNNEGRLIATYTVNSGSGCLKLYDNKLYSNGTIIYFDVVKGEACSKKEYENSYDSSIGGYSNSNSGYNGMNKSSTKQNSCLKFYAFNDSKDSFNLNLLLDHNTTDSVHFSSTGSQNGPSDVLLQLNKDTNFWAGTNDVKKYEYGNSSSSLKYTISYSGFRARLISANEIAKVINNNSFNEITTNDNISIGSSYGWLYDRTSRYCKNYGCSNNINNSSSTEGYWTESTVQNQSNVSFSVNTTGIIARTSNTYNNVGVRPVIEVDKNKLHLLGDADCDGDLDNDDYNTITRVAAEDTTVTNFCHYEANLVVDDKITIEDATCLSQYLSGSITSLPCKK